MLRRIFCKLILVAAVVFYLMALFMADTSFAQGKSPDKRVLIGFKGGTGRQIAQQRKAMVSNLGGDVHHSFHIIPVVSARLPEQAMSKLKDHPQIAYIEDDIIMHIVQTTPWGIEKIGAPAAWGTSRGAGVHVAILDTGIDYDHDDLDDNIEGGVYFAGWIIDELLGIDGSTNPIYWNDGHGHGTHCAGIVAAEDDDKGVVGVAPNARLHAVKVLGDDGSGWTSDIVQGIEWCIDNNIDVASMSFGGGGTASLQNACNAANSAGVILVGAAGNDYRGPVIYPAAYSSVIAVSATTINDTLASFSNVGSEIELGAPGVGIMSTLPGNTYQAWSGTSMACPHVSGVAALIIAANIPNVRSRLQETAIDLGATGKDNEFGYGRVNAAAAVAEPGEPIDNPPNVTITNPSNGDTVSGTTVAVAAGASDDNGVTQVEFFVDGGSIGIDTTAPYSVSWNSNTVSDGSHTIMAKSTDTIMQTASDSITVDVDNYNDPPVADAGSNKSASVGETINFNGSGSYDPDGSIVSYDWDFGDGDTDTGVTTSHAYSAAGTYNVNLTVTDNDGETDTDIIVVTVTEAADFSVSITNHSVKTRWDKRNGIGKVEAQINFTVSSGSSDQIILEEVTDGIGLWELEKTQSEVKINGVRYKWDAIPFDVGIFVAVIDFNGVTLEAGDDVQIKMKFLNDAKGTHTLSCFILDSIDILDYEQVSWSW